MYTSAKCRKLWTSAQHKFWKLFVDAETLITRTIKWQTATNVQGCLIYSDSGKLNFGNESVYDEMILYWHVY